MEDEGRKVKTGPPKWQVDVAGGHVGGCGGYVGGLGPFKFEKVLPAYAGSITKSRDGQRTSPSSHQGPHFWGRLPPVPLKEEL